MWRSRIATATLAVALMGPFPVLAEEPPANPKSLAE